MAIKALREFIFTSSANFVLIQTCRLSTALDQVVFTKCFVLTLVNVEIESTPFPIQTLASLFYS